MMDAYTKHIKIQALAKIESIPLISDDFKFPYEKEHAKHTPSCCELVGFSRYHRVLYEYDTALFVCSKHENPQRILYTVEGATRVFSATLGSIKVMSLTKGEFQYFWARVWKQWEKFLARKTEKPDHKSFNLAEAFKKAYESQFIESNDNAKAMSKNINCVPPATTNYKAICASESLNVKEHTKAQFQRIIKVPNE